MTDDDGLRAGGCRRLAGRGVAGPRPWRTRGDRHVGRATWEGHGSARKTRGIRGSGVRGAVRERYPCRAVGRQLRPSLFPGCGLVSLSGGGEGVTRVRGHRARQRSRAIRAESEGHAQPRGTPQPRRTRRPPAPRPRAALRRRRPVSVGRLSHLSGPGRSPPSSLLLRPHRGEYPFPRRSQSITVYLDALECSAFCRSAHILHRARSGARFFAFSCFTFV